MLVTPSLKSRYWPKDWRDACIYIYIYIYIYSIRVSFTDTDNSQDSREREGTRDHLLLHSTTSTRSRTFRHFFATLHVRWLSHIFNRNACIYQTATRWDLPPYRITVWLIDDVILIFVYLLVEMILGLLQLFAMRNQWTRTRINYHPCIISSQKHQLAA